ncbi:MAG TPA: hypothetical protein VFZ72_08475, partial [Jiangellaceae bacterium]
MTAPSMEYVELLPIIIVLAAAVIGVLIEAFVPRGARRVSQLVLSMAALVGALAAVITQAGTQIVAAQGSISVDGPALFIQGVVCVSAIVGLMFFAERQVDPAGDPFAPSAAALPGSKAEQTLVKAGIQQTEVYPLALFATGGMLLFPAANDLLMLFIALEVLSLPLYVL